MAERILHTDYEPVSPCPGECVLWVIWVEHYQLRVLFRAIEDYPYVGCGPGVAPNSGVNFDLVMMAGFAINALSGMELHELAHL